MAQKLTSGIKKLTVVRPSVIATTFSARSEKFLKQQRLNFLLAGLYAVQAVLVAVFGHTANYSVWLHLWAKDPLQTAAQEHIVFTQGVHKWFDLDLHTVVVLALVAAAVGCVLFATVLRDRYEQALARRLHDMRWLLGAGIASLLVVATALLLGIADAGLLLALIGITIVNGFGVLAVEANQKFWPWSAFVAVGMITGLAVITQAVLGGALYGSNPPWYVYTLLAIIGASIAAALANLWLQIRGKDKWSDYVFAEMMYAGIGFVSISASAWILFVGVL